MWLSQEPWSQQAAGAGALDTKVGQRIVTQGHSIAPWPWGVLVRFNPKVERTDPWGRLEEQHQDCPDSPAVEG